ncbi:MAG: LysM domain-containing protein [Gammaproteobacteria bacterium]
MGNTDTLTHLIEQPLNNQLATPLLYVVKGGDTLSQIITSHYAIRYNDPRYKMALASVLHFNDSIYDPNEIRVGQLIRLMPLPEHSAMASCPVPEDFYKEKRAPATTRHRLEPTGNYVERFKRHIPTLPKEQDAFWALAWMHENYGLLSTAVGAGFNTWGGLTAQANNAFIAEVKTLYNHYQRGALSKSQYDYRRRLALKKYSQKIGPFEKMLFKGKTANEAIRISRTKSIPATATIDNQLDRLKRMARYATRGGIILTAAGVGMGCYDIGQASTRQQKNEVFVETFGSTAASIGTGALLTLYFVGTPTGWVTALTLGIGAAALSLGAGKGSAFIYDRFYHKHDLVKLIGIDQLCK